MKSFQVPPQRCASTSNMGVDNKAIVECFFDSDASNTATYLVACPETDRCVVIDPVLDFDYPSCTLEPKQAKKILTRIEEKKWKLDYILETHVHADHITSAQYLREKTGAQVIHSPLLVLRDIIQQPKLKHKGLHWRGD
jgi:glyoxylase-like metal-dependent hydrolase (beta-lactamase superfamily II)